MLHGSESSLIQVHTQLLLDLIFKLTTSPDVPTHRAQFSSATLRLSFLSASSVQSAIFHRKSIGGRVSSITNIS